MECNSVNSVAAEARTGERSTKRKNFSLSFIPKRFNHKCLCMATIAAIEWPIEWAVYLVVQRAKYVAKPGFSLASGPLPSPSSKSLSRLA